MLSNASKYAIRAMLYLAQNSSPENKIGAKSIAKELETKFNLPFGRDTVQSFTAFIRGMKR